MLGTQLLKRNQELSLLYEKVRIQESTLAKGEAQYKVRLYMNDYRTCGIWLLRTTLNLYLSG